VVPAVAQRAPAARSSDATILRSAARRTAPARHRARTHPRDHDMAKILATEIRAGNLLEFDKRVWRVLKSYHVHVGGRGGAYMQIEIKDIESGQKRNERLSTDEKVERPFIDRRTMTYSYHDGANWVFMDNETYEQLTLGEDFLEGQTGYLMPNMEVEIVFHDGRAIGIQLPSTVVLEVVDTEPGIKNATATTSFKPAKLETGISVQVPPFVNTGEKIRVSTDDGSYVERA
jgi:elongation factor P